MLFCACRLSVRVRPCFRLFSIYYIVSCNFYFSEYKKKQKKQKHQEQNDVNKNMWKK